MRRLNVKWLKDKRMWSALSDLYEVWHSQQHCCQMLAKCQRHTVKLGIGHSIVCGVMDGAASRHSTSGSALADESVATPATTATTTRMSGQFLFCYDVHIKRTHNWCFVCHGPQFDPDDDNDVTIVICCHNQQATIENYGKMRFCYRYRHPD